MADDKNITIEVDGRQLDARPGQMLIEVTDAADITVPRFCYHKNLSISANCRMCLVEVENAPKPLPACATPCMEGMKVFTKSPLAREAQKGTMEFLLINHPLDCPICDQGGECELQDVAVGYGSDVTRYTEAKRIVPDPDLGPLVATDMTRCIHCTRCVRFGDEIAGLRELGATGRGEHMKIGTYVAHAMTSELSGNVIDLCPVGALTSKPFRFQARAWEMTGHPGIAPHDSVGSNIEVHVRRNQVLRVIPSENGAINETWLADRDRYSYTALNHKDRLKAPMIKEGDQWREASWEEALRQAANSLAASGDADQLAALVSPSATLEEMALAAKLLRGLGSRHIESRLRMADFRYAETTPWLGTTLDALEQADAILLIGSNVRKEQPLINHRIRKAALAGARVMAVNPVDFDFNYELAESVVAAPSQLVDAIDNPEIREQLEQSGKALILIGNLARSHPDYSLLAAAAARLGESTGAKLGFLPEAANSVGAWLAGAVNANAHESLLAQPRKSWLLTGVEPEHDTIEGQSAVELLGESQHVVALTAWRTLALEQAATVMLPIAAFTETSGTLVNCQGDRQSFAGIVPPPGEARPAWKVLRVLGNLLDLDGFDYSSSEQVRDEVFATSSDSLPAVTVIAENYIGETEKNLSAGGLERIPTLSPYAMDALSRRSESLQRSSDGEWSVHINAATARDAGLSEGDTAFVKQGAGHINAPVTIDERVPDNCVWCASGVPGSENIGGAFGEVTLEKVS
ncbi:MAG: NADH-quinone oxidoreductase subunit NuoG [Pseudomonadota bacterium]